MTGFLAGLGDRQKGRPNWPKDEFGISHFIALWVIWVEFSRANGPDGQGKPPDLEADLGRQVTKIGKGLEQSHFGGVVGWRHVMLDGWERHCGPWL